MSDHTVIQILKDKMHNPDTSKFEDLPNEILLDIFGYMNSINLLQTFYDLNIRFNLLLYKQFRSYSFHFRFISKRDFKTICQQHLPSIANQVITLHLFDGIDTPDQINLFFSYVSSFQQFIHLQSLSLYGLHSYEILLKLLDECQYFPNFIRLYFRSCYLRDSSADYQLIMNKIWSLPKLTTCYLDIKINERRPYYVPTIVSTSIKTLNISSLNVPWNDMNRLIEYTPYIESLSIYIPNFLTYHYAEVIFPTLTKLYLYFCQLGLSRLNFVFQSMPNLRHLSFITFFVLMNGHQWEHTIRNYLPKLQTFRLQMHDYFHPDENIQQEADDLYNSFSTTFWINERKWFVWCLTKGNQISVYTHFNRSIEYSTLPFDSCRSTCPDDNPYKLYNKIIHMHSSTRLYQSMLSDIHLFNIIDLHIEFPIGDHFWSIIPNLNKLKTLSISFYTDIYQSQLERLFNQASNLYRLFINQDVSLPLQMSIFTQTKTSIRELNLRNYHYYFNEEECFRLTCSNLGKQCEMLFIQVSTRESILILVKNMAHLRSLKVQCAGDQYQKESMLANQTDELVEWLKERLLPPSSYVIVRNLDNYNNNISIWM